MGEIAAGSLAIVAIIGMIVAVAAAAIASAALFYGLQTTPTPPVPVIPESTLTKLTAVPFKNNATAVTVLSTDVTFYKIGDLATIKIIGAVGTMATTASVLKTAAVIPTAYLPLANVNIASVVTNNAIDQMLGYILVGVDGTIEIQPFGNNSGFQAIANFALGSVGATFDISISYLTA